MRGMSQMFIAILAWPCRRPRTRRTTWAFEQKSPSSSSGKGSDRGHTLWCRHQADSQPAGNQASGTRLCCLFMALDNAGPYDIDAGAHMVRFPASERADHPTRAHPLNVVTDRQSFRSATHGYHEVFAS
jgi:hypothetical protein